MTEAYLAVLRVSKGFVETLRGKVRCQKHNGSVDAIYDCHHCGNPMPLTT